MPDAKVTPTFCKINIQKETLDELKEIQERAAKLRELLGECVDFSDGASGHHCLKVFGMPLPDSYVQTDSGNPATKFNNKNSIKPKGEKESIKKVRSKPIYRSKL